MAPHVVLVSREVSPMGGGGIGRYVSAAAHLLGQIAEVTVITSASLYDRYEQLRADGDPHLPGQARFAFIEEPTPEDAEAWLHPMQLYSHRVLERIRELFGNGRGPDLIEFADFLAEGFVTLQAAEALDPLLTGTRIAVRIHTTAELVEVLNGSLPGGLAARSVHDMERYCLARADHLIWQGGDVLGTYARFYDRTELAPTVRIRYPYRGPAAVAADTVARAADPGFDPGAPLRLLYAGRIERRKGVHNLVRAMSVLPDHACCLTIHGADTDKAPLGISMLEQINLLAAELPSVRLAGPVDREALATVIRAHDAVIIPSIWECWPYAALEPLQLNRPVLGTPVGGLVEMLERGGGWLADGTSPGLLGDALERLVAGRGALRDAVRAGAPLARGRELSSDREILEAYGRLLAVRPRHGAPGGRPARPPLVTAVVPAGQDIAPLATTVASLQHQTHDELEIVVVAPGPGAMAAAAELPAGARIRVVAIAGGGRRRAAVLNAGITAATGRYVFVLEPGWTADPAAVARGVAVLEGRGELAYVAFWLAGPQPEDDPWPGAERQPLGNRAAGHREANRAGGLSALLRRRVFELGHRYPDLPALEHWPLYAALAGAGQYGVIVPERLVERPARSEPELSAADREHLQGEIEALVLGESIDWLRPAPTADVLKDGRRS